MRAWESVSPGRGGSEEGKGLDVRLSLGYEMSRASNLRLFVQADGILPTYKVTRIEWTDWRDPSRKPAPTSISETADGRATLFHRRGMVMSSLGTLR